MLTMALLGLATAAGYSALKSGALRLGHLLNSSTQKSDETVALSLMARDLRCAFLSVEEVSNRPTTILLGRESEVKGFDRIDLTTTVGSGESTGEAGYSIEQEKTKGTFKLIRRAQKVADDDLLTGGSSTPLCADVAIFKLLYFDGKSWRNQWGWDHEKNRPMEGIRGLPLLVSIQLNETTTLVPVMTSLLNQQAHL